MPSTQQRVSALDSLRTVLALSVCVYHTQELWHWGAPQHELAVDLFFLLGGFVVARSYEGKLLDGRMSFRDFVVARLIRLYPLYLLSMLACALPLLAGMLLHHRSALFGEYVKATLLGLLMLPAHVTDDPQLLFPLNIVFWSLMFALITNFLYAGLIRLLTDRALWVVTATAVAVLVALAPHANGISGFGASWGWQSLVGGMARATFGMVVGVLLCRHHTRIPRWMVSDRGILLPLAVVVAALCVPASRLDWLVQPCLAFVVLPWAVASAVRAPQTGESNLLSLIGAASYPIYVLNIPLLHLAWILVSERSSHLLHRAAPFSGLIFTTAVVLIALGVDRWFDRPVRRWLAAKASGLRPPAVQGVRPVGEPS